MRSSSSIRARVDADAMDDGHGQRRTRHRGSNCTEACSIWCVGWSLLARIPAEVALGSARAWLSAPVPDNLMDGGFNLEAAQRLSPDVGRCRYKELSNMERREMGSFCPRVQVA